MSTVPRRLEQYELLQLLGKGHVGEVWKAHDFALQRDVALKIFHSDLQADPHFLNRFSTIGQQLSTLHHQNIVQVYETKISRAAKSRETTAYLVMDYIEGYTLADYIQSTSHRGAFPGINDIIDIFNSIGEALDYAHEQGILHGNITPENIRLSKRQNTHIIAGEPMLTDFGIAHIVSDVQVVNSPFYISPEQAQGMPITPGSDIYALGIILYKMCTGVVPFRNESSASIMMQHIRELPTPPMLINSNIPPALSSVILRALAKDPITRFVSASQFAAAIAEACSVQPSQRASTTRGYHEGNFIPAPSQGQMQSILGVPQPQESRSISYPGISFSGLPTHLSPNAKQVPTTPATQLQASDSDATWSQSSNPDVRTSQPISRISGKIPLVKLSPKAAETNTTPSSTPALTTTTQEQSQPLKAGPTWMPPTITAKLEALPLPPKAKSALQSYLNFNTWSMRTLILTLVVLIVLLGTSVSLSMVLNRSNNDSVNASSSTNIAGHVFFQDDGDGRGRNDQLRIDLQNITPPADGQKYVAWLQDINNQTHSLGTLTISNSKASLIYQGDGKNTNLLLQTQGLIITSEATNSDPSSPGQHIVYQGTYNTNVAQALRELLVATPDLPNNQAVISGILDTVRGLSDKSVSITDSLETTHDNQLAKRQAARIIEMIDGTQYAMSSGDLPKNVPNQLALSTGLISSPSQIGYIDALDQHLDKLKGVAGNNQELLQHIQNTKNAVTNLRDWIAKMRASDVQILKAADLADPAITSVALQLKQTAADAYTGKIIPPATSPQPTLGSAGAFQAYTEVQYLATLDIKAV